MFTVPISIDLITIFVIVLNFICIIYILWCFWKTVNSKSWPVTEGKIVGSFTYETEDPENEVIFFTTEIRYEYFVNGITYISDRIEFGSDKFISSSYPNHLSSGNSLNVYYNPKNPNDAVIINEIKVFDVIAKLFFIIFFIFIIFLMSRLVFKYL